MLIKIWAQAEYILHLEQGICAVRMPAKQWWKFSDKEQDEEEKNKIDWNEQHKKEWTEKKAEQKTRIEKLGDKKTS